MTKIKATKSLKKISRKSNVCFNGLFSWNAKIQRLNSLRGNVYNTVISIYLLLLLLKNVKLTHWYVLHFLRFHQSTSGQTTITFKPKEKVKLTSLQTYSKKEKKNKTKISSQANRNDKKVQKFRIVDEQKIGHTKDLW